jgi:acetyl-CoA decarbonylase/synthase complex subunit alpha
MSGKSLKLSIEEVKTESAVLENVEIAIGEVVKEDYVKLTSPILGPSLTSLRNWDLKLLKRYRPFYLPFLDLCCFCTYGKCDFTRARRGVCGIDVKAEQARFMLLMCCMGASAHIGHAKHLVEQLIRRVGRDHPIELGSSIDIEAPIIRTVTGMKPGNMGDLEKVCAYLNEQLVYLLSATSFGQEADYLDLESKALHAGMIDNVALEVADLAQVAGYGFPKGDPKSPLVDFGLGIIDGEKPVILCIGHNVASGIEIIDYLTENQLYGKVEVCGICCTAQDLARYPQGAKIVGSISRQLETVRSGFMDVIIIDEQCIRANILSEAQRKNVPVIAVSPSACFGLPDKTGDSVDNVVEELASRKYPGVLILDPRKAGEVAVKTAIKVKSMKESLKKPPPEGELRLMAEECVSGCQLCQLICPAGLLISEAVNKAKQGSYDLLAKIYESCLGCGRCEAVCPKNIPVYSLIIKALELKAKREKRKIRAGRGPILDTEIRKVAGPIVRGEIPGIIIFAGCANYLNGEKEVAEMAEEFLRRKYIVLASGCSAMALASNTDGEGKTLYEKYPGDFDAGCLANLGPCVANAHAIGAALKIAEIFARKPLRANYEEIADYVLNRVGAVIISWGATTQKNYSIATGANRFGIPVIFGPQGSKYRRLYLGRMEDEESWIVYDSKTGEKANGGPTPEHLMYVAESKEEAVVTAIKLCMRSNDTPKGRQIKLTHYLDLCKKFYGTLPEDLPFFIRVEADIPIFMRDEVLNYLKRKGWSPKSIPDPTLLEPKVNRGM